jgi:hypothetical protein
MAIWNREKIVVLIAIGVWVTDVAFLIYGEYLVQIKGENVYIYGDITGTERVSHFNLDGFRPTRLI